MLITVQVSHFFQKILIGLLSLVLFVGCTSKDVPRVVHQAPGDTQPDYLERESVTLEEFDRFNLNSIAPISEIKSADQAISKVLKPLSRLLFSDSVIGNKESRNQLKFTQMLRELNKYFNYALEKWPNDQELKNLSKIYVSVVGNRCDENLTGGCPYIEAFRNDAVGSSKIIQFQAEQTAEINQYYWLLRLAYQLRNRSLDRPLALAFLSRAQEYAQFIQQADGDNIRDLKDLSRIFQNILTQYIPPDPKSKAFTDFIVAFKPWKFSRLGSDDLFGGSGTLILNLAAKYTMYDQNGRLNSQLVEEIKANQISIDKKYPGIVTIINILKSNPALAPMVINLNINHSFEANEYFFIVDRLFSGHLSNDDASTLWLHTQKNSDKLIEVIEKYIQVQIAYMVAKTNQSMTGYFNQAEGVSATFDLLKKAVEHGISLYSDWDAVLSGVSNLSTLINRHIKRSDSTFADDETNLKRIINSFNSLRRNIKFISVYPNMMMLAYLMVKENFRDTIRTFWGSYKVNDESVIKDFLGGEIEPWFSFGTDNIKLKRTEILYSFYFALMTETFATFSENKIVPVDDVEFLRTILTTYLRPEVRALETELVGFNKIVGTSRAAYSRLMQVCSYEKNISVENSIVDGPEGPHLATRPYSLSMSFDDLMSFAYTGSANGNLSSVAGVLDLIFTEKLQLRTKIMRTKLQSRISYVKNMIAIMKAYYERKGKSTKSLDEVLQAELSNIHSLKEAWFKEMYRVTRETQDCYPLVHELESTVQYLLLKMEREHLAQAYDDIFSLRTGVSPEEEQEILERYKPKGSDLPEEYVRAGGYNKISKKFYSYSKMDFLVRLRKYLAYVAPHVKVNSISFKEQNYYRSPNPLILAVNESTPSEQGRSRFIAEGMAMAGGFLTGWTGQHSQHDNPEYIKYRVGLLVELYNTGPIALDGDVECTNKCLSVDASELINEGLIAAETLSLKEFELEVISWFGAPQKYKDTVLEGYVLESGTRRELSLLDWIFQSVASDSIMEAPINSEVIDEAKEYYNTYLSLGSFFFQPHKIVNNSLKTTYVESIANYTKRINNFLRVLDNLNSERVKLWNFNYGLNKTISMEIQKNARGDTMPVYVSPILRGKVLDYIRITHQNSDNIFKVGHEER